MAAKPIGDDENHPTITLDNVNKELNSYIKTAVRYAFRQGMTESQVRKAVETALNAARDQAGE